MTSSITYICKQVIPLIPSKCKAMKENCSLEITDLEQKQLQNKRLNTEMTRYTGKDSIKDHVNTFTELLFIGAVKNGI